MRNVGYKRRKTIEKIDSLETDVRSYECFILYNKNIYVKIYFKKILIKYLKKKLQRLDKKFQKKR